MKIVTLLFFLATSTLGFGQNQWVIKDSLNGAPRSVSSSFVLNGEGYVMAGLDVSGFRRKMYSYTPWQDDWDDELSIGGLSGSGLARGSASSFSIGNKGYICLGQGETNPFFQDLWEYDLATQSWSQKADFAGSSRRQAVAFVISDTAYVGTGIDVNGLQKDMYKYDSGANTWTQINDFGGTARKEAAGFAMGGQGYVGTGDDGVMKKDFWQYQPETDSWFQKADFPGTARKGAAGFGIFPTAFICTGEDINFNYTNDLWEYNYYADAWVQRADYLGAGRTNAVCFVLNDLAYVGTGYNSEGFFDDFYAYRRIVGLDELEDIANVSVYPNPIKNTCHIKSDLDDLKVEVYSLDGKEITHQIDISNEPNGFLMNRLNMPNGQYMIRLIDSKLGVVYNGKVTFV